MSSESYSVLKVADFAHVKGGKRMPAGTSLVSEKTNHPYIRIVDFKDGSIDKVNLQYVPDDVFPKISRYVITSDDLYISIVGTIGLVGTVPDELCGANLTENAAKICQIDNSRVNKDYLGYFLRSDVGQNAISALAVGSTQPKLALFRIEQIEVPCPSISTQCAIAEFLGALDDRITLLRETNATLEAIAQALFKSWFVDFDPVHANAGSRPATLPPELQALFPSTFTETPQGLVPEGWKTSVLGDICRKYGGLIQTGPFGSQLHASDYVAEGIPVVMPRDIVSRRVEQSTTAKIGNFDALRLAKHHLKQGDIVFSRRGDVEKHALIGDKESGWLCGTGCLLVRPGKEFPSPPFLSRSLDQAASREWLIRHAVGATMPNLNTSILEAVPVLLPSTAVLIAFEKLVGNFECSISHNIDQSQTLATLRDTLLPRLISGQLRLPEAEALIEETGA